MALVREIYCWFDIYEIPEVTNAAEHFSLYIAMQLIHTMACFYLCRAFELKGRVNYLAESRLDKEKCFWKQTLKSLPDSVVICCKGKIVYFNRSTIDLLDLNASSLSNISPKVGDTSLEKEKLLEGLKEIIHVPDYEKDLSTMISGQQKICETACNFIYRDAKLSVKSIDIEHCGKTYIEYILQDVTHIQELEKSKAMTKCFNLLIATASHEIRTPLNAIDGVLDMVSKATQDSEILDQLKIAQFSSKRMLLYLKGLAFLQCIEIHSLHLSFTDINVIEYMEKITKLFQYSVNCKGLKINFVKPSCSSLTLSTDKEKFELILYNVLQNAVKYTFKGGIIVSFEQMKESNQLRIDIKDTGVGISDVKKMGLFRLFPDVNKGNELCPQGIGMGLYLCQQLITNLHGNISIESTEGIGTKVTMTFNVGLQQQSRAQLELSPNNENSRIPLERPTDTSLPSAAIDHNPPKVLLVDDEPINLMILKSYLKVFKGTVDIANNGKEAVDKIQESACGYKMVFMDINMPIMDGIEATKQIVKITEEKKCSIKIIAVTAAAHLEDQEINDMYQKIGFTEILQKPVSLQTFINVFKKHYY